MLGIRSGKRRGFTLIELLVVIAIIAILAAILFPVFARAREAARASSCRSNMKQLGTAIQMYTQDYDEQYPGSWYGVSGTVANSYTWRIAVHPYVKNAGIFQCPSHRVAGALWDPTAGPFTTGEWDGLCGYGFNEIHWDPAAPSPISRRPEAMIDQTASTIVLAEMENGRASLSFQSDTTAYNYQAAQPRASIRHSDGANFLFADGHVKWLKPGAVAEDQSVPFRTPFGGGQDGSPWSVE